MLFHLLSYSGVFMAHNNNNLWRDKKLMYFASSNDDLQRHLLPWFRVDNFETSLYSFRYVLECLNLTALDAAEMTGNSEATIRRWKRTDKPPIWVKPYLLACCGFIITPGFEGWRVFGNKLYLPNLPHSDIYTHGLGTNELNQARFTIQNAQLQTRKINDLTRENQRLRHSHAKAIRRKLREPTHANKNRKIIPFKIR